MIAKGSTFPQGIQLKSIEHNMIRDFSTDTLKQGRYVVFGVPGAFTMTCSTQHVPSYRDNAATLFNKNIQGIFCISVNDAFVMQAWAKSLDLDHHVTLLADADGALTKALDATLDLSHFSLGIRSKRYSMIVEEGIVHDVFIENDPTQCDITAAQNLLHTLS